MEPKPHTENWHDSVAKRSWQWSCFCSSCTHKSALYVCGRRAYARTYTCRPSNVATRHLPRTQPNGINVVMVMINNKAGPCHWYAPCGRTVAAVGERAIDTMTRLLSSLSNRWTNCIHCVKCYFRCRASLSTYCVPHAFENACGARWCERTQRIIGIIIAVIEPLSRPTTAPHCFSSIRKRTHNKAFDGVFSAFTIFTKLFIKCLFERRGKAATHLVHLPFVRQQYSQIKFKCHKFYGIKHAKNCKV